MSVKYKCKICGFVLDSPDFDCPHCSESNMFSGGQTVERKIIRDRINKVIKNEEDSG